MKKKKMPDSITTKEIIGNHSYRQLNKEKSFGIKKYDFKRPDKFSKDQIRTLQMIHETFARLVTANLSATLRSVVNMHLTSIDQMTFEELMQTLSNPTNINIINMNPLKGRAIIEMDPTVTYTIIDILYGGLGIPLKDNREMTDIELSIMEEIIDKILKNLSESWSTIIDLNPQLDDIETSPMFAQIVPPNDMVIKMVFDLTIGEYKGQIHVCFPYITLESIIYKLSAQYWFTSIRCDKYDPNAVKNIGTYQFESHLFLETEDVSLRDISQLKKGSLIRLPYYKNGNASLQAGIEPILFLKNIAMNKRKKFEFDVQGNLKNETEDIDLLSVNEKNKGSKEIMNLIKSPINELSHEIKQNIDHLTQKVSEISDKWNTLDRQLYSYNGNNDINKDEKIILQNRPFNMIQQADKNMIVVLIQNEHPQAIALILSYFEPNLSAYIFSQLDDGLQVEVAERIAHQDRTHPLVIINIERILEKKIKIQASNAIVETGGVQSIVEVLNLSSRSVEKHVIETLEKKNPELAENIKMNMFVFEDILILNDKIIKRILKDIKLEDLALALKGVNKPVKEHFFKNMLKDDKIKTCKIMEEMGPVRLNKVEKAQQGIVCQIRILEENGEIVVARADEEIV